MRMYEGSCEGSCHECICQNCEGNCAMNCLIDSYPEKIAKMNDEEDYVVECMEFDQFIE